MSRRLCNLPLQVEPDEPDLTFDVDVEAGSSSVTQLPSTKTRTMPTKQTSPRMSSKRSRHPRGTEVIVDEEKTRKDRGKKRKELHSDACDADAMDVRELREAAEHPRENAKKKKVEKQEHDRTQKKKPASTPILLDTPTSNHTVPQTMATNSFPTTSHPTGPTPATPSLKIRLRLPPHRSMSSSARLPNSLHGKPSSNDKQTSTVASVHGVKFSPGPSDSSSKPSSPHLS
jgi:hypothetical protein